MQFCVSNRDGDVDAKVTHCCKKAGDSKGSSNFITDKIFRIKILPTL